MSNTRNFKGVWIPAEIWLSETLTTMEKLFLVEIDSLDGEHGCYASNKHFSNHFDLSKNRCTEIIKSLESKGFISIAYKKSGGVITKRILRVIYDFGGIRKTEQGYSENLDGGIRKTEQGYSENREGNNTKSSNTKSSNTNTSLFEGEEGDQSKPDQENKTGNPLHAGKEKKNDIPEELNIQAWEQFKVHRKAIKKKLTPQGEKLTINKLITLSKTDQAKCVERTIENGWTGIFPESVKPKGKESFASVSSIHSKSKQPRIVTTPLGDVDLSDPYALVPTVAGVLVVCERDQQTAKAPIIKEPDAEIAHPPNESPDEHIEKARQRAERYKAQAGEVA